GRERRAQRRSHPPRDDHADRLERAARCDGPRGRARVDQARGQGRRRHHRNGDPGYRMTTSLTKLLRGVTPLIAALFGAAAWGAMGGLPSCTPEVVAVQPPKRCELQLVTLDVIASKLINPTPQGEPRPVQLRIYQLASDIRLQNASFEEIWKHDAD